LSLQQRQAPLPQVIPTVPGVRSAFNAEGVRRSAFYAEGVRSAFNAESVRRSAFYAEGVRPSAFYAEGVREF